MFWWIKSDKRRARKDLQEKNACAEIKDVPRGRIEGGTITSIDDVYNRNR